MSKRCKLCDRIVHQTYKLTTSDKLWYHCQCGCMFNDHFETAEEVFTPEHNKKLLEIKSYEERYDYLIRVYAPLIEEKVYGRKMLDVGFGAPALMQGFEKRGWIAEGIDVMPNDHIQANFESYDFFQKGHDRYDLIWMGDVLQCFQDPVKAIYKAYHLLKPFGILFIITPNTDLMRANRVPAFGHWDLRENNQFLSEGLVHEILDRCDESLTGRMKVVYCDPEITSKRFITCNNMHMMAQKTKIEDIPNLSDIKVEHEEKKSENGNAAG